MEAIFLTRQEQMVIRENGVDKGFLNIFFDGPTANFFSMFSFGDLKLMEGVFMNLPKIFKKPGILEVTATMENTLVDKITSVPKFTMAYELKILIKDVPYAGKTMHKISISPRKH